MTQGPDIDKTKYRGWWIARHEDGLLLDGGEAASRRWFASNKRHTMIVRTHNPDALRRLIDEYEDGRLADSIEESGGVWSKLCTGASLAKLAERHNASVGFETEHGNATRLGVKIWLGRAAVRGAAIITILLAVFFWGIWWLLGDFLRAVFSGVMWLFSGVMWLFSPAGSDAWLWIGGTVIVLWLGGVIRPWR